MSRVPHLHALALSCLVTGLVSLPAQGQYTFESCTGCDRFTADAQDVGAHAVLPYSVLAGVVTATADVDAQAYAWRSFHGDPNQSCLPSVVECSIPPGDESDGVTVRGYDLMAPPPLNPVVSAGANGVNDCSLISAWVDDFTTSAQGSVKAGFAYGTRHFGADPIPEEYYTPAAADVRLRHVVNYQLDPEFELARVDVGPSEVWAASSWRDPDGAYCCPGTQSPNDFPTGFTQPPLIGSTFFARLCVEGWDSDGQLVIDDGTYGYVSLSAGFITGREGLYAEQAVVNPDPTELLCYGQPLGTDRIPSYFYSAGQRTLPIPGVAQLRVTVDVSSRSVPLTAAPGFFLDPAAYVGFGSAGAAGSALDGDVDLDGAVGLGDRAVVCQLSRSPTPIQRSGPGLCRYDLGADLDGDGDNDGDDLTTYDATYCVADSNGDGIVDVFDLLAFLDFFFASDPAADLNCDGAVTDADNLIYNELYFAGCG